MVMIVEGIAAVMMTRVMSRRDTHTTVPSKYLKRMEEISAYVKERQLPSALASKVTRGGRGFRGRGNIRMVEGFR